MATTTAKILSGKEAALSYREVIRRRFEQRKKQNQAPLSLAAIQIGEPSADVSLYSKILHKELSQYGVSYLWKPFSADPAKQNETMAGISKLYADEPITGVMIFSPIPPPIETNILLNLPVSKDIEGRTYLKGPFGVFSPTANAVLHLLKSLGLSGDLVIKGKHAVMVGHSDLVGKATALNLLEEGATVTICHKDTVNLEKHVREADILVVAIGKRDIVKVAWMKETATVIDVGENVVGGRVVGDIDFDAALKKVAYISPVPGGVGPLTTSMVIHNLLTLSDLKHFFHSKA